jgi:hypothetical protein
MRLAIPVESTFAVLVTANDANNSNDCAVTDGRIDLVAYRYYSNGPKCATNSGLGGIESSIYHGLQRLETTGIPDCRCMKFDQGGAGEGWLMYGPAGNVDLASYCGPVLDGRLGWDCSEVSREL